jgi:DNA-binding response OmpR family regulator
MPRALVAIPEQGQGQLCREILEASGFLVEMVDSGVSTLVAALERTPQLIFMDLQLRDVPAREAVGWLRSNLNIQAIPVIILAGATDEIDLLATLAPGVILRKPLSPEAIRRAIQDALENDPKSQAVNSSRRSAMKDNAPDDR